MFFLYFRYILGIFAGSVFLGILGETLAAVIFLGQLKAVRG